MRFEAICAFSVGPTLLIRRQRLPCVPLLLSNCQSHTVPELPGYFAHGDSTWRPSNDGPITMFSDCVQKTSSLPAVMAPAASWSVPMAPAAMSTAAIVFAAICVLVIVPVAISDAVMVFAAISAPVMVLPEMFVAVIVPAAIFPPVMVVAAICAAVIVRASMFDAVIFPPGGVEISEPVIVLAWIIEPVIVVGRISSALGFHEVATSPSSIWKSSK